MSAEGRSFPCTTLGVAAALLLLCAATASETFAQARSPSDRYLNRPPYYTGSRIGDAEVRTVHLPISYQRGSTHAPIFDPEGGEGTPVAALIAEMNAFLDSLGVSGRLGTALNAGNPPDVHFGCELDPSGECTPREEAALGRGGRGMRLAVDRPNRGWVSGFQGALVEAGAERAIVIALEVGQYWTRQQGLRGDKIVDLGTGYSVRLPWLTSLETPVVVLQLTGALVDRQGRVLRIGAEGIVVRRTPLLASSVGAQALLRDEDVENARSARREDLSGEPLVWQLALKQLVAQLTGRANEALTR